jgi:hypothetical protein
MNAPEPYMTALLRVIYYGILDARATAALANEKDSETQNEALKRVVSIMNVIHNIPMKLTEYEKWDEETFKKFLGMHDKRFPSGIKLLGVYENGLKNPDEGGAGSV